MFREEKGSEIGGASVTGGGEMDPVADPTLRTAAAVIAVPPAAEMLPSLCTKQLAAVTAELVSSETAC